MIKENLTFLNGLFECYKIKKYYNKITGGRTNIFRDIILPKEDTLSNIIAFFLDPRAAHEHKSLFLKEFINKILKKNSSIYHQHLPKILNKFYMNVKVKREYSIGDGRIDIIICFPDNFKIIIENKPFAGETESQLKKYIDYFTKKNTEFIIVYMPGEEKKRPQTISIKEQQKLEKEGKFVIFSYKDLKEWMELCSKICKAKPLKEFIKELIEWIDERFFIYENKIEKEGNMKYKDEEIINSIKYFLNLKDSQWEERFYFLDKISSTPKNEEKLYQFTKQVIKCFENLKREELKRFFRDVEKEINKFVDTSKFKIFCGKGYGSNCTELQDKKDAENRGLFVAKDKWIIQDWRSQKNLKRPLLLSLAIDAFDLLKDKEGLKPNIKVGIVFAGPSLKEKIPQKDKEMIINIFDQNFSSICTNAPWWLEYVDIFDELEIEKTEFFKYLFFDSDERKRILNKIIEIFQKQYNLLLQMETIIDKICERLV